MCDAVVISVDFFFFLGFMTICDWVFAELGHASIVGALNIYINFSAPNRGNKSELDNIHIQTHNLIPNIGINII